jgi:uncharacterized protein
MNLVIARILLVIAAASLAACAAGWQGRLQVGPQVDACESGKDPAACLAVAKKLRGAREFRERQMAYDEMASSFACRACAQGHSPSCLFAQELCPSLGSDCSSDCKSRVEELGCARGAGHACAEQARTTEVVDEALRRSPRPSKRDPLAKGTPAPPPTPPSLEAQALWRKAIDLLAKECQAGQVAACSRAGKACLEAKSGSVDRDRAIEMAGRACELKETVACEDLVTLLDQRGRPEDKKRELAERRALCTAPGEGQRLPQCLIAGTMCLKAQGVPEDLAGARELFDRGCAGKDGVACAALGHLQRDGKGVAADKGKALETYRRGCELKAWQACGAAARMLYDGDGVPQDHAAAADLWSKTCGEHDPVACLNAGMLYHEGKSVPRDSRQAYNNLAMACQSGSNPVACVIAGSIVVKREPGAPSTFHAAVILFKRGCNLGNHEACVNRAIILYHGAGGVDPDVAGAIQDLEASCKAGFAPACDVRKKL